MLSTDQTPFEKIHSHLQGVQSRRRDWYHAICPNCGKEPGNGQIHFSYHTGGGGHCFVCGWSGGAGPLLRLLNLEDGYTAPPRPQPVERQPEPLARWRLNPHELLRRYQSHPDKLKMWNEYKPLTQDTIEQHRLGFGSLPFQRSDGTWYMSRKSFLIVPVFGPDGELVRLHGRNLSGDGPEWICATGSGQALYNASRIQPGRPCWLVENYVDACWMEQERPDESAVAIGGATTWKREWAAQLAACHPSLIIVGLDNDLVGNGGGNRREEFVELWKAQHPKAKIPIANGPRICNDLIAAGLTVRLFPWPADAPHKAGMDWVLGGKQ